MRVYLKYKGDKETLIRTDRTGKKQNIKKGMVLNFDIDMAKFYEKNYPKMFIQVDGIETKKKSFVESPKLSYTKPKVSKLLNVK